MVIIRQTYFQALRVGWSDQMIILDSMEAEKGISINPATSWMLD